MIKGISFLNAIGLISLCLLLIFVVLVNFDGLGLLDFEYFLFFSFFLFISFFSTIISFGFSFISLFNFEVSILILALIFEPEKIKSFLRSFGFIAFMKIISPL